MTTYIYLSTDKYKTKQKGNLLMMMVMVMSACPATVSSKAVLRLQTS